MKFVLFGDIHLWVRRMHWKEWTSPKRWLGAANLALKRARHFPPAYRLPAIEAIKAEEPDTILFTGDFTSQSLREEFVMATALFEPLLEKVGNALIAIPGNHDRYTKGAVQDDYLRQLLTFLPRQRVFTRPLAARLTVVGIDHSYPMHFRSNGQVTDEVHEQLREALERMRRTNQTVILLGHFPYACPPDHPESWNHKLLGEHRLAELVREFKPALYVHGHKHVRWAIHPHETPDTLCLNPGSIGMHHPNPQKQAGYLVWDMNEKGELRNLHAKIYDGHTSWRSEPISVQKL